jgi:hypothetical protein
MTKQKRTKGILNILVGEEERKANEKTSLSPKNAGKEIRKKKRESTNLRGPLITDKIHEISLNIKSIHVSASWVCLFFYNRKIV